MKRFIEFTTNIYNAKEMAEYQRELEKQFESEFPAPGPEHTPIPIISKIAINPEEISNFSECYSLEESHYNLENPKMNQVQVTLTTGESLNLNCTFDKFKKELEKYNKLVKENHVYPR